MAAVFVVLLCAIACLSLPVTSNGNDFNAYISAYLPGVIHDVLHVSDFAGLADDGQFLNGINQPQNFDWFASSFLMPYDLQGLLERRNRFSLMVMNSSWGDPADTNVFYKGEQLNLQLSANPGPGQQLYVQSCHASSSPNPADKPEVALIINKGCVASKKSLVKFVLQRSDTVNLVVRTSSLNSSEIYLHCRVYLSDVGLTPVTKFCNYNKLKSRWVDLGGQVSVCDCCGRRCRSIEHTKLPDLSAVVSTGPLIIKDPQPASQASSLPPSNNNATNSSHAAKDLSDKRYIMAGASFSGHSMQDHDHVAPWPDQPGFGGVIIVKQGLGGDFSPWLQDLMELEFPPVEQLGIGFPENPVDETLQSDEPFSKLTPDDGTVETSRAIAVDDGTDVAVVDSNDVGEDELSMWLLKDVAHLNKIPEDPAVTKAPQLEQPQMNFDPEFDFPTNDLVNPTPDRSETTEDKGDVVFRQAEMVFKSAKKAKLLEPDFYYKLSLKQAADGSSTLNYEEKKRLSLKQDETPLLELDSEKRQKDEQIEDPSEIKGLVSSLLDKLRSADW